MLSDSEMYNKVQMKRPLKTSKEIIEDEIKAGSIKIIQIHGPWDDIGIVGERLLLPKSSKNCGKSMEAHGFESIPGLGWTLQGVSASTRTRRISILDTDGAGSTMFTAPTKDFVFNIDEVKKWMEFAAKSSRD